MVLLSKILSIENGQAVLDIDGNNTPADANNLVLLGITAAEQQRLAALYNPGDELWRVPLTHFSAYDFNVPWAWQAILDAIFPNQEEAKSPDEGEQPCSSQPGETCTCFFRVDY